jgi:hypothetical protein
MGEYFQAKFFDFSAKAVYFMAIKKEANAQISKARTGDNGISRTAGQWIQKQFSIVPRSAGFVDAADK